MAEPTREQLAQDYARALTIIDGLRTRNAELLAALKALRDPAYGNPTSPADTARIDAMADAVIAKAEGR